MTALQLQSRASEPYWLINRLNLVIATAMLCLSGCTHNSKPAKPQRLTVAAAASLAEAFRDIVAAFEAANPETQIELAFGGSNQIRAQLENGGPGDVFASADRKQMDAAIASNVVNATSVRCFAWNRLALIVPRRNTASITQLADLARPGVKIVVADGAVPAGSYTSRMLEKAGSIPALGPDFVSGFEANIVSKEENVAAVVAKVALDEADAGIAYMSDASGASADRLTVIPLPPQVEQKAEYMIAVTSRAENVELAERFIVFLISAEGNKFLVQRGFTGPDSEPK